jgi:hypothetical protein
MGLVMGKYRLRQRKEPIGGKTFFLLLQFTGVEGILILAVTLTLLMQFRRRVFEIIRKLYQSSDCLDCLDSSPGPNWVWVVFFALVGVLAVVTLWKSREVRRFVFNFFVPFLGLVAAAMFTLGLFAHEQMIWFYAVLLSIKACVLVYCFFEIEIIQERPDSAAQELGSRPMPIAIEGNRSLQVSWLGIVTLGVFLWFTDIGAIQYSRSVSSLVSTQESTGGLSASAQIWVNAIESKKVEAVQALTSDSNATEVFNDPVRGKFVFFTASDSSPEIFEALLTKVNIPDEFVEHSFARLASLKNCKAFDRLVRYGKSRHVQKPAGITCNVQPVRDNT